MITAWPDRVSDAVATDATIPAPTCYGIAPGPTGYAVADLRCAPGLNRRHADGIYGEAGAALVLSGCFEYASEGRTDLAIPGALVFANQHEAFTCRHRSAEGNRRIVLFFSDAMLTAVSEDLGLGRPRFRSVMAPPSPLTPVISALLVRIARFPRDSDEAALAVAQAALQLGDGRRHRERVPARDANGVVAAVRYVNANYTADCTLDTLAAVAGMSRFRLARRFRAVTGTTAAQYVVNRRLSAAANRLASTTRPIAEIAFDAGFNDLSYFNARFKSTFGCAPGAWRRR